MIVPSRSKTAISRAPAVSLLRSFIVLGRTPRVCSAAQRVHLPHRGGDRGAVHLFHVGLPVEHRRLEGERSPGPPDRGPGSAPGCGRRRSAARTGSTRCTATGSGGRRSAGASARSRLRATSQGPLGARRSGDHGARPAGRPARRPSAAARPRPRRGTATRGAARPGLTGALQRVRHEVLVDIGVHLGKGSGFLAPEPTWKYAGPPGAASCGPVGDDGVDHESQGTMSSTESGEAGKSGSSPGRTRGSAGPPLKPSIQPGNGCSQDDSMIAGRTTETRCPRRPDHLPLAQALVNVRRRSSRASGPARPRPRPTLP